MLMPTPDGIPSTKLKVAMKVKAYDIAYIQTDKKSASLPEISSTTQLDLQTNNFKANKFVLRVPDDNMIINGSGQLKRTNDRERWQTQGEIIALWRNLSKFHPFVNLLDSIIPGNAIVSSIQNLPDGKLFLDLKFAKDNKKNTYDLEATAADCKIDAIIPWLEPANQRASIAPLRSVLANLLHGKLEQINLEEFCLSPQAKFAGTLLLKSDGELALKDCSLEDGSVLWKFSGNADQFAHWTKLQLSSKDLPLAKLTKAINGNQPLANRVRGSLGLNSSCQIVLAGKAQVSAKLNEMDKDKEVQANDFACEAVLNDAELHLSQPAVNIRHISGTYASNRESLILKNIRGDTATGTINIDANIPKNNHQPLNFHLHANTINLPDLLAVLQLFHIDTSGLNRWQLSGKLKEADLVIAGIADKPLLRLTAIPSDMIFAFPDAQLSMHANSGKIIYSNDNLAVDKLNVSTVNSNFLISFAIKNPSSAISLEKLSLSLNNTDLSDLQACLPVSARPIYLKNLASNISSQYQISGLKGKISGNLEYVKHGDQNLHGAIDLDNISLRYGQRQLFVHNLKGKTIFAGNDLLCRGITGNVAASSFSLEGRLLNYGNKSVQWHGDVGAQIVPADISDILYLFIPTGQASTIKSRCKKTVAVKIKSSLAQNIFSNSFTLLVDADAGLSLSSNDFNFQQPSNTKLLISGSCRKDDEQWLWNYLTFDLVGSQITFKGSLRNNVSGKECIANISAQLPEYMQASLLKQSFFPDMAVGTINGRVKGSISLQGPISSSQVSGKIYFSDVSLPALYLAHATGEISLQPQPVASGEPPIIQALMHLKELNIGRPLLTKASGTLIYSKAIYVLKDFAAEVAAGQLTASGKADLKQKQFNLDFNVKDANLDDLWPQITNSQIDADGPFDCHFTLESTGVGAAELEENLAGSGTIHVGRGAFNRSGKLHARLNQVNLLHQGIFGFNVNNLLQSVLPAKASEFYSIDGAFGLSKEVLTIRSLLYDSRDLKFSAAGKANVALHSLELDVAGVMPRVSTSVIHGPLGQLSREITLQKLLDSVTLHKLDKLPSLPLLGGIGNKTDLFTCRIVAPYNQPKLISQSIQKSFQWLNYRPATAPGKHAQ